MNNLLENAIKYGAGRPIEVWVDQDEGWARVEVRDHGGGIDPVEQDAIFQRFQRARAEHTHAGFGLGLWIVRRFAEAHGGSVRVISRVGEGATFIVTLPTAPASEKSPDQTQAAGNH